MEEDCKHCGTNLDPYEDHCTYCGAVSPSSAGSRLPYPLRSAEELAGCMIMHGLLDGDAWHDPEGWDGGIEKDQVYKMLETIREHHKDENDQADTSK